MEKVEKGEPLEDKQETKYFSVMLEKREVERDEIREFCRNEFMWVHINIFRSVALLLKVIVRHRRVLKQLSEITR